MEDSATAPSAILARACRNCATAKTKCVLKPGSVNNECERCCRLKRPCIREIPIKKRKPPSLGKSVRLEKKLDHLVSLLSNPQAQSSASPVSDAPRVVQSTEPSTQREASPATRLSPQINGEKGALFAKEIPRQHTTETCHDEHPALDPEEKVVQDCLSLYQTYMSKHFPFVVLPPETTVTQMRETSPFLLKVIVAVASYHDLGNQRELGSELVNYVATHLLVRGERNVDLLQGLLVFIAWYHPHFFVNPQTSNLLQLAVGLTIDLGLKRSARAYGQERIEIATTRAAHGELSVSELHTSDERRALLGTFYLTTIVAQWAKRYDSMRYSAQLEDVCNYLEKAQEYPSDRYLVALVRLQHVVQRVERKVPFDDFTPDTMIPISMFVKQLHTELDIFRHSLAPDLAENTTLLMHYYNAEIYLYEISLSPLPPTPQYADFAYRRLEMLNACMQSAKAFMSVYAQLPNSSYYNLPFVHFSQLTSAIIALSKLSRLACPGWDIAHANHFIGFPALLNHTAARYEEARSVAEVPVGDNPIFTFFARKLRFVKAWNEAKLKGVEHTEPRRNLEQMTLGVEGVRVVQSMDASREELFNVFNQEFWQGLDVNWDLDLGMGACSGSGWAEDGGVLGVGLEGR